jgi:hypothetical protein
LIVLKALCSFTQEAIEWSTELLQSRQPVIRDNTKKVITPEQAAIVDNISEVPGDQDLSGLASSSSVIAVWQQKWTK